MTIVTINGDAWVVGVTWRAPAAWRALRFMFPPPDTQAFVHARGQPGFVTDRNDATFAGAVSLGAALRFRRHVVNEPWIAAVECDDGRIALIGHFPDMPHLAPEMVLDSSHGLPALMRVLDHGDVPVNVYATPALAIEGALPLDLAAVRITDGMRLRQRAAHSIAWPAVAFFLAGGVFTLTVLALAAALFVAPADAQELLPLPPDQPVETEVTMIGDTAPVAEEPVTREPAAPDLDEATAAIVTMLTAPDAGEGPPMADCAIDLLRTRLAAAVAPDDILAATALEDELLRLCLARQQLVGDVLATELQLAALIRGETEAPSLALDASPAIVPEPPPAPALDQLTLPDVLPEPEPETEEEVPAPSWVWTTMLGTPGNMRAALTDGAHVWWVREGDILPGDWQVIRIATRPPGVSLRHAETGDWALAHGSGGGG